MSVSHSVSDLLRIMGCASQQQEMPIVILMIDIIMTNKLTEVIVGPKSAISDHKLAKIEKMP